MTSYTLHLLGLAVESCNVDLLIERVHSEVMQQTLYEVGVDESNGHRGETLAEALAALLTDLGVEVPGRPSAGEVESAAWPIAGWDVISDLRDLYAREPLTVLALLEGGES